MRDDATGARFRRIGGRAASDNAGGRPHPEDARRTDFPRRPQAKRERSLRGSRRPANSRRVGVLLAALRRVPAFLTLVSLGQGRFTVSPRPDGLMNSLRANAWLGLLFLGVVMWLALFIPAGTVRYWQAWVFLAVFMGACAITTLYVTINDPALLERRMSGGPTAEKRPVQKLIMLLTSVCFLASFAVPALDHRFGWSAVPAGVAIGGDVMVALGFLLVGFVYRENTFASATIEVSEHQRVISTGPYAIVRHPMYAGGYVLLLGTPLALGSYWGLVPSAAMLPLFVWRLLDEERFLAETLPGYTDYQRQVRHRLVPFVW